MGACLEQAALGVKGPDGSQADGRLLADLERLRADVARRRLRIFRSFLARQVRIASPLLVDACGVVALDDASWRLRPPLRWPRRLASHVVVRSPAIDGIGRVRMVDGVVVARPLGGGDRLVMRVAGRSAHMLLRAGPALIGTDDHGGRLRLPGCLSPAQARGLIGSQVEDVYLHAITLDQPYTITAVVADPVGIRTMIEFHAAPIEWRPPWARRWASSLDF